MANELDQHVCLFDPAIKWGDGTTDATDRDTWPVERDIKKLVLHDGMSATVFHAAKLTFPQNAWCKEVSEVEACGRAFRVGVRRVVDSEGKPWMPASIDDKDYFAMKASELERFENVVIEEIGALILQAAKLPFGLKPSFMLRPSSLHVSDANARALRCAELNAMRSIQRQQKLVPTP